MQLIGWSSPPSEILKVSKLDDCVVIDFTISDSEHNSPCNNEIIINKYVSPYGGCGNIDAQTRLECWGIDKDFISSINYAKVEGTFRCHTNCPYPQTKGKFEEQEQVLVSTDIGDYLTPEIGQDSAFVGVRFPNFRCPSAVYCTNETVGFSASGKLILCSHKECPICPEPSEWSECINGEMTRTVYVCNEETNYECKPQIETAQCEEQETPTQEPPSTGNETNQVPVTETINPIVYVIIAIVLMFMALLVYVEILR